MVTCMQEVICSTRQYKTYGGLRCSSPDPLEEMENEKTTLLSSQNEDFVYSRIGTERSEDCGGEFSEPMCVSHGV